MADRRAYLTYDLVDGFVGNWLVAGPVVEPASQSAVAVDIDGEPVERGPLSSGQFRVGSHIGVWTYVACPEDRAIDHSAIYPVPTFAPSCCPERRA
jgi:hypothetical protein